MLTYWMLNIMIFLQFYVQSSVKTMLLEPNKIANNTIADLPSY